MKAQFSLALAVLSLATLARAEPKVVVKLGTVAPDGTPWAKQIQLVRKHIHEKSKGVVKVKVYTGFSKGGEKSIVRRCVQGSLQMCGITVGSLATVINDLDVLELPYLFDSSEQADRILDGNALALIKKMLAKKGLVFYGWSENGWRGFGTNARPIRTPADLKGMKMRAQESRVHVETYRALGALPNPVSLPEVLGALQTGVVEGYDNTPLYLFAASWYQHTKYFTLSNHIYQPAIIAYNKAFFDKQPADVQALLLDQADKVTSYGRKLIRKLDRPLLNNLKSAGIQLIELTPVQRAAFAKKTKGVHQIIRRRLGADGRKLLELINKEKS
jgi:tripartite ATP-independent transporter DctP family solute receptor